MSAGKQPASPMQDALQLIDIGIIVLDSQGRIETCNRWVTEHARLSAPVIGLSLKEAFGDLIDPRLVQATHEAINRGRSSRLSHAFHPMPMPLYSTRGPAMDRIHQAVDVLALVSAEQRKCLVQIRDMSETLRRENLLKQQSRQLADDLAQLHRTQEELARHSLRFREMARLAPVGLFETDMQGRLTYCNDRGLEMLMLDCTGALGRPWTIALGAEEATAVQQRWEVATQSATRLTEEFPVQRADAGERWLRLEAGPIRDANQVPVGFICTLIDVTDLTQRAQRHEHRANHDPLTGLPNRARFEQRVLAAMAGSTHLSGDMAIVYVDLDGFKRINDVYGHAAGDFVLQTVGQRLRKQLRGDDLVARLGGDEFALLFPEAPSNTHLSKLLAKLSFAVELSIKLPAALSGDSVQVGCSMGTAVYPRHGSDIHTLLAQADRAMYAEKGLRRQAR
ncbi:diguanylate cyclase [Paucibacter sp. AS339]|uniref:diguanylate cyclase domain-containing protein n=1 Tax=Paucibacter hankyongi TaxID=3133434 RepID=UPI0030A8E00C